MLDLALLRELCDANGVSGFEDEVRGIVADKIKKFCDNLYVDPSGNLVAYKKGKKSPQKKVMYAAHLDEVGFMIKYINDDGTLLFDQVGMMPEILLSKRVLIGEKKINGVVCSKPVHLINDKNADISVSDMYIDIGAYSKKESENMGIYAQSAAFCNDFCVFGNGTKVRSKAIDDRFGCLVMIEMIMSGVENDSYFVFTTGEELGGVGAIPAVREIKPYAAFIFESTTASDIPSCEGENRVCSLGKGAVVPFMDGGAVYDKELYTEVRKIAAECGIKTQTKTKIAGGTDAATIQRSLDGVRVCAISLACRYIHTASCVADTADMIMCMRLAHAVDESLDRLL